MIPRLRFLTSIFASCEIIFSTKNFFWIGPGRSMFVLPVPFQANISLLDLARSAPSLNCCIVRHDLLSSLSRDRAGCIAAHPWRQRQWNSRDKEQKVMADFTPISAAIGGALIGLSAVLLMLLNGRIAGVTGVFAGLIDPTSADRAWRATFIAGLIAAPLSASLIGLPLPLPQMPTSLIVVAAAGLLVGFGTRLSNGCTSGHGVCGIARLSPRSIAATVLFMAAAIVIVALTRHVFGG
jgi:uncharacterized protein